MVLGPLTAELGKKDSPVRQFFDEGFTSGLRDVQRRYRQTAPSLVVPPADRQSVNPGTLGTAADWLLRFLLHPRPPLALAAMGASLYGRRSGMLDALTGLAVSLGYDDALSGEVGADFTGPVSGNDADPSHLASACWALALLTEMYRNPMVALRGPLERFQYHRPSVS